MSAGQAAPQPRPVLVVDDETEVREMVAEYLREQGFQVVEASNGLEALVQLKRVRPGAVVLDLMMPRLGGLDALKRIRGFDPAATVVVVTGLPDADLHRRALDMGARAVLTKPVGLSDLLTALGGPLEARVGGHAARPAPSAAPRSEEHGGRILIVDDDPEICAVLEEFLSRKGFQIRSVGDGAEALDAISQEPPDVVLLDFSMPRLGGLKALVALRSRAPEAKVIMISGLADLEEAKRTLAYGAFDYIAKPVDLAYLDRSVEAALLWKWLGGE